MIKFKVSFTENTFDELKKFVVSKHGMRRAISITIEQAVKEFLDRQVKD